MVRVLFEIEIPGWDIDGIRKVVRDLDILDCGEEDAIAIENVKAWDILSLIASGELGLTEVELTQRMVQAMDAQGIDVPLRPNMVTDVYGIVQDRIYNV